MKKRTLAIIGAGIGGLSLLALMRGTSSSTRFSSYAKAVQSAHAQKLAEVRGKRTAKLRLAALLQAFPDANPAVADKYSSRVAATQPFAIDEFGRPYKGGEWDPVSFALQVYEQVAPYLPLPPGSRAAIASAIALGRGKSLKDAALEAARSELPPGAQMGFDIGVGIANGAPVDKAALDAVWEREPQAKAGYDLALKAKHG